MEYRTLNHSKFYSARRKQLKQFTKILKNENPEDSL